MGPPVAWPASLHQLQGFLKPVALGSVMVEVADVVVSPRPHIAFLGKKP